MPRKPKKVPNIITKEQLEKILFEISKTKNKFLRNRNALMIIMSYYLGLRPKETRCIKISHIDFEEKKIFIPAENNKQRNDDEVFIPDFLIEIIRNYIFEIPKKTQWLFPSNRSPNLPIDNGSHIRFFKQALKKSGLLHISYLDTKKRKISNLSLYSLRHSFGTIAYQKLKDITQAASLLRHYDFQYRSALRYVHTANKSQRRELMEKIYSV